MPILFIRYILPVLLFIYLQVRLSLCENKFIGLIIPAICLSLTAIFSANAFEFLGVLVAWSIMLIPNVLSITLYTITRKIKKSRDEQIIKNKFAKRQIK